MSMHFSIFEILMLVCFGASWPFALIKTYKTKVVKGTSRLFLSLIFIGYLCGILHKIFYMKVIGEVGLYFRQFKMFEYSLGIFII